MKNTPHWIDTLVGIFKKAEHVENPPTVFDVVDPKALGPDDESIRAIEVALLNNDVVVYWKGANTTIFEKTYKNKDEAIVAFKDITKELKTIEDHIEADKMKEAADESKAFLEKLELQHKKETWDTDIVRETEETKVANKGILISTKGGKTFEFSNDYLEKIISPSDIVNTLPGSFINNVPSTIYSTFTKEHISKNNFTGLFYNNFLIGEKKINTVAVFEKSGTGKPLYYIVPNCSIEKFEKVCKELTPTMSSIGFYDIPNPIRLCPNCEQPVPHEGLCAKCEQEEMEKATQKALTPEIDKPELNTSLNGDVVKDDVSKTIGSLGKEAKKESKKEKEYNPQDNAEAGYRISDWDLQHPNTEMVAFETPLIAMFDKTYGLYEIQFLNGVRTRLQGDTFKMYLYNSGFRPEHVEEILKDVVKGDVILYGDKHELAKKFADRLSEFIKKAYKESEIIDALEKELNLDKTASFEVGKIVKSTIESKKVPDEAIKLAITDFLEKNAKMGIIEIEDKLVYEAIKKTDPYIEYSRFNKIADYLHKVDDPRKSKDNHAEEIFTDGLESEEILEIRKRKLEEAKKSKNIKYIEANLDKESIEVISLLKDNPEKVETFSALISELENENQIDSKLAEKYRSIISKLKKLKEI
jgi:hypothetical protein